MMPDEPRGCAVQLMLKACSRQTAVAISGRKTTSWLIFCGKLTKHVAESLMRQTQKEEEDAESPHLKRGDET